MHRSATCMHNCQLLTCITFSCSHAQRSARCMHNSIVSDQVRLFCSLCRGWRFCFRLRVPIFLTLYSTALFLMMRSRMKSHIRSRSTDVTKKKTLFCSTVKAYGDEKRNYLNSVGVVRGIRRGRIIVVEERGVIYSWGWLQGEPYFLRDKKGRI